MVGMNHNILCMVTDDLVQGIGGILHSVVSNVTYHYLSAFVLIQYIVFVYLSLLTKAAIGCRNV